MTPAVASERSIFSKNHDSNSYLKSFPCRGEHVRTYISGCRCTRWQKTICEQTHTHTHAGQLGLACEAPAIIISAGR